jgi:hypothetical protein
MTPQDQRGLDLLYKKYDINFCNIKFRKEIETLIFLRNLSNIEIGEICWERTGNKKIENLNACFLKISIAQRDDSFIRYLTCIVSSKYLSVFIKTAQKTDRSELYQKDFRVFEFSRPYESVTNQNKKKNSCQLSVGLYSFPSHELNEISKDFDFSALN